MSDAQRLVKALNEAAKGTQFDYRKARAVARGEPSVDWPRTKAENAEFNEDVDGCESFVLRDGSVAQWRPGQFRYTASR